jgi:hypothetical protein
LPRAEGTARLRACASAYRRAARCGILRTLGGEQESTVATYVLAHGGGRLWELDTGHDMMLIEPGWVADKLVAHTS